MINYGKKSLIDALNNHLSIKNIYITKKGLNFLNILSIKNIKISVVDESFFKDLAHIKHQYVAYEIEKNNINQKELIDYLKNKNESIILILDSIEDPRNFGSILRTCDAFKIDAVFYKKNNQCSINETVNSISMGATNYLSLCEVTNLNNLINELKQHNYWVYSTTLNKNSVPYFKENYPNKICIVVGNENKGVSDLVIKNSDMSIYIPMHGHVQSLNVSVATGIILSYLRIKK